MLVEVVPAKLSSFFDASAISKRDRQILAALELRILQVRGDLLANSPEARSRARHQSFLSARETFTAGRPMPDFAQIDRAMAEKYESARMTRALLGADLWATIRPILARLGGDLQRRRPSIESDLRKRAADIGIDLPVDSEQFLAIGALIGTLIPVSGSTGTNFQTPIEVFAGFGYDLIEQH